MTIEARVTVHQKGSQKPDYKEVHARMSQIGYTQSGMGGGTLFVELHGMYRKFASRYDQGSERQAIEGALRTLGFPCSVETFEVTSLQRFEVDEAPASGGLAALLGSAQPSPLTTLTGIRPPSAPAASLSNLMGPSSLYKPYKG